MEEIKPVVTQKIDFGYQGKSISFEPFHCLDYPDSDAKNKLTDFSFKTCSPSKNFFIETLMKEIRPVVTEQNEYEYRGKSKLKLLFGAFRLQGDSWKYQNH